MTGMRSTPQGDSEMSHNGPLSTQSDRVSELRRNILASLIAVKPYLDQPYRDDPRWTPWTRFVGRTLDWVDELAEIARKG